MTSNRERIAINNIKIKRFAHHNNLPVLMYYDRMRIDGSLFENECMQAKAYTKSNPEIKHYFCKGAPCVITKNINTNVGITNGTFGVYHSLTFETPLEYVKDLDGNRISIHHLKGRTTYEVPHPYAVNALVNAFNGDKTVLVPVLQHTSNIKICGSRPARTKNIKTHFITPAFAITYHKLQGRTLKKVILVINFRKKGYLRPLDHESVYVGLSRVMKTDDIRLYPIDIENADHLFNMKPHANLVHWDNNYNKHHKWVTGGLRKALNTEQHLGLKSLKAIKDITQSKVIKGGITVAMMKDIARQLRLSTPAKARRSDYVRLLRPHWENTRQSNQ